MKEEKTINLSVVVLVYNTSEFLHQCFDSLLSQTLESIEIIVVDDESTDNSLDICNEYASKYENFRVVTQKSQGGAVAGTTGMKLAKGKYIALVDSDDFLVLDAYETLYNLCEEHSADMAIGRPLRYINGKKLEVILPEEKAVWEEDKIIHSFKEIKTLFHDKFYWNKIFKREFIEKHAIYMPAEYLYADFLMVHRAYEFANTIAVTNKVVYYWRRHPIQRIQKSASQNIASCENYKERAKSLLFESSDNIDVKAKFDDIKLLLLSFTFHEILEDRKFRETFLNENRKVLETIDYIAQYNIHPEQKLRFWLLKENCLEDLFYILGKKTPLRLVKKNNKVYCGSLPFFDNKDFNIPNEVYEYKMFRKEFIKNFICIDYGKTFRFQVLLHHIHCLPKSDYYLFFKDKYGTTVFKCRLASNGDYFSVSIEKKELFSSYEKLFLGIGDEDNIIFRIDKSNVEAGFNTSKNIQYIFGFDNHKMLFLKKRNILESFRNMKKNIKELLNG